MSTTHLPEADGHLAATRQSNNVTTCDKIHGNSGMKKKQACSLLELRQRGLPHAAG